MYSALQVVGLGDPNEPAALVHAPLTIAPVPFPKEAFQRAKDAATARACAAAAPPLARACSTRLACPTQRHIDCRGAAGWSGAAA